MSASETPFGQGQTPYNVLCQVCGVGHMRQGVRPHGFRVVGHAIQAFVPDGQTVAAPYQPPPSRASSTSTVLTILPTNWVASTRSGQVFLNARHWGPSFNQGIPFFQEVIGGDLDPYVVAPFAVQQQPVAEPMEQDWNDVVITVGTTTRTRRWWVD